MKHTFPRLRQIAADRDVTLTELDLRWGITEEESQSGKVVEICLREIENSIPFFVGIIGNRYGWVPNRSDLASGVSRKFSQVDRYVERHLSVTEMEMQFGVLERQEDMHAFFYIKEKSESADVDEPEMLERLKTEVRNSRYPASVYSTPEDLSLQVENAFISLLNQLFPEQNLSQVEMERIKQRSFLNHLCQNYVKDEANFEFLDTWLADWTQKHLVIIGASGQGKSALVANWISKLLQDKNKNFDVVYHFVGNGGSDGDQHHITRVLIEEISELVNASNDGESYNKDKFERLLGEVSHSGRKILIVLDAINQIIDVDDAKQLRWIPAIPENVKVLYTSTPDDYVIEMFKARGYPMMELKPMNKTHRRRFVNDFLSSYGKKLNVGQVNRIISADVNCNALVLASFLDELIRFGVYEDLDIFIDYYLQSSSVEGFYKRLLNMHEKELGTLPALVLSYMLVSKNGLRESEIIEISGCNPLQWSEFYAIFRPHFVVKGGLIYFSHEYLRKAVRHRYIDSLEFETDLRKGIVMHLNSDFRRRCDEIPYQEFLLGSHERLHKFLLDPKVFAHIYSTDEYEIGRYWKFLIRSGYSILDYQPICREFKSFSFANDLTRFCSLQLHDQSAALEFSSLSESFIDDDDDRIRYLTNLASIYRDAYVFQSELEYRTKVVDLFVQKIDCDKDDLAFAYLDLGECLANLEDYQKAEENTFKALSLYIDKYGESNPRVGTCYNNLSVIYEKTGKVNQALDYGMKSLKIRRSWFGDKYLPTLTAYNNVANVYCNKKDYPKALELYRKTLGYAKQMGEDGVEMINILLGNIAAVYMYQEDYKKACKYYEKAYLSYVEHVKQDKKSDLLCDAVISTGRKAGMLRKVFKYQKISLKYGLDTYGNNWNSLPYLYNNIGVISRKLGYYRTAINYGNMAVEACSRIIGKDDELTAIAYDRLATSQSEAGLYTDAETSYAQALRIFCLLGNEEKISEIGAKLKEINEELGRTK